MADIGTRYTDRVLEELERKIARAYREAQHGIEQHLADFVEENKRLDEIYRERVDAGTMSEAKYRKWQKDQLFFGKVWEQKQKSIEKALLNADKQAARLINDSTVDVFAENANYVGYDIDRTLGASANINFALYDAKTVAMLLRDEPELLPQRVVDGVKAGEWNRKQISNAILQGILQGEDIEQIAHRIARDTSISDGKASIRYARTAMTGAQNAGRMERLREATEMGINVRKRWLATLDSRTRDAHQHLDGQVQDVDKPFESDLGDIMYPGDPEAHPSNVYNCRCTLVYVYPDFKQEFDRVAKENGEYVNVGDITYDEWKREKETSGGIFDFNQEEQATHFIEINSLDDAAQLFGKVAASYTHDEMIGKSDEYEKWESSLTDDEKQSIGIYTDTYFMVINNYLRGVFDEDTADEWLDEYMPSISDIVKNIEKAISRFDLTEDIKVHRTASSDVLKLFSVGDEFTDKAFTSTGVLEGLRGTVEMIINVPRGTGRGAWIQPLSVKAEENEFLLQRGSVFTVDEITETEEGNPLIVLTWKGVQQ